jgi:hypothetical protein
MRASCINNNTITLRNSTKFSTITKRSYAENRVMIDLKRRNSNQDKKPTGMRNVVALGFVSFFTDFSTEMILGILPLFIVTNLGASKEILRGIEGSAELVSYAFRMISGALSDKLRKRKIFVLIGYGLSTISKPFFAISTA